MRMRCERESDTVKALRTGLVSSELQSHIARCRMCTETEAAARVVLATAASLRVEDGASRAGLIWRRAEARKKEIALERATRPLLVMRILSVVYVVLAGAWFLRYVWRSSSARLLPEWNVMGSEIAAMAALIALAAIAIGALYMLNDSRRSVGRVSSS
jgi:hypothetical protein